MNLSTLLATYLGIILGSVGHVVLDPQYPDACRTALHDLVQRGRLDFRDCLCRWPVHDSVTLQPSVVAAVRHAPDPGHSLDERRADPLARRTFKALTSGQGDLATDETSPNTPTTGRGFDSESPDQWSG
jgi:hypothetical protein